MKNIQNQTQMKGYFDVQVAMVVFTISFTATIYAPFDPNGAYPAVAFFLMVGFILFQKKINLIYINMQLSKLRRKSMVYTNLMNKTREAKKTSSNEVEKKAFGISWNFMIDACLRVEKEIEDLRAKKELIKKLPVIPFLPFLSKK